MTAEPAPLREKRPAHESRMFSGQGATFAERKAAADVNNAQRAKGDW